MKIPLIAVNAEPHVNQRKRQLTRLRIRDKANLGKPREPAAEKGNHRETSLRVVNADQD